MGEKKKKITIDNSKESAILDGNWGDVDKIKLRNELTNASNAKSLVKEAYLIVEDGWEEAPSEHLKYPHHDLVDDKLVVHKDGCQSALAYLEQHDPHNTTARNHLKKHYKELGLDMGNIDETGGKQMAKKLDNTLNIPEKIEPNIITNYCAEAGLTKDDALFISLRAIEDLLYQAQDQIYAILWEQGGDINFEELANQWAKIFIDLADKVKELIDLFKEVKAEADQKGGNLKTMDMEKILDFVQSEEFDASKAEELVKTLIAKHGIKVENVSEELVSQVAELSKSLESMKEELTKANEKAIQIENDFKEYKEKIEAEKNELRKDAVAMTRMKELEDAGIVFSEERAEKVMKRLREMDDEAFADYKDELLEIAKISANEENQEKNTASANENNTNGNEEEDFDDTDDYRTLARKVMANRLKFKSVSFVPQVEGDKNGTLIEKYTKLQESINYDEL